jgi:hypothetical protein
MTTRQRQAPGNAIARSANGADTGSERLTSFSWEDWFRHASSQQRADALGLAQQQGLLYPHQLPPTSNGVKPTAATKEIEASPVIARLLAGKAELLARLQIEPLTYFDAELDDLQRQAVARAIHTPDLLLLQGLPGTGKSRVLTEIVLQAAARGWRMLFLAGQTASLDVVLQRLVGRPETFALRFLDTAEKLESLPAWLRGFTLDEQKQAFQDRVLAGARANHQQAEALCQQRQGEEPLWAALQTGALRYHELEARLHTLQAQFPSIADDLKRETESANTDTPFLNRLLEIKHTGDEAIRTMEASLQTQQAALAKCAQEASEQAARIAEREPAYLAKKHGRFWTLAYWTNLFNGSIIAETEALQEQHVKTLASKQEISLEIDKLHEQKKYAIEQSNQQRTAHLDGEIRTRQQALALQRQSLDDELAKLDAEWATLCRRLDANLAEKTPDAIAMAHHTWQQKKKSDEQQCQFAQQWTKFVEEAGPSLAAKLPSFANLLAATILRWHTDAKMRDAVGGPFDLLIVEDAETLTEADLLKLSRHASRCVLVGLSLAEPTPTPTAAEKAARALLPAPLVSAACWNKLWQTLGGDAGRWQCAWQREQGRLVCQLMPLGAEDRQHLDSEGLADAPDIELRILHRPRTRPCLAEVIFGPHCSFAEAFRFMMREVQEFPLEPLGRTGWWSEDAERICLHLGPNTQPIDVWLEIEPGVRLGAVGDATRTACLDFDKAVGWDRAKAEAWLHQHRPVHDHERTIYLQTPYRFERPLAQIVQSVVRVRDWLPAGGPHETIGAKAFEFVAVPPFTKQEWPREGAGLELDLTAARHADRLPVGLRQSLPAHGFVNYLEAQALIRRLETWQRTEANASRRVAVLALYEGQVQLLRRLVEQSEVLRARDFVLEVALPSRLHQRECDVVFLSLTRSHAHRCVAFGEDVKELPLALTRPRSRLLVFGDPGSLFKRTTWHGPLDHLDALSGQQELLRLSCLLSYLQKHGHGLPTANGVAHGRE